MSTFKLVICFIGAALLLSLIGIAVLQGLNGTVPDVLVTVAVASLTALTGMLAKEPGTNFRQGQPEEEGQQRLF